MSGDQTALGPESIDLGATITRHGDREYIKLLAVCRHGVTMRDDYDIDLDARSIRAAMANLVDTHRREVQQPEMAPCTCPVRPVTL